MALDYLHDNNHKQLIDLEWFWNASVSQEDKNYWTSDSLEIVGEVVSAAMRNILLTELD